MTQAVVRYVRPQGLTLAQWNSVKKAALSLVREATPVDTGRLKSSWEETASTSRSVTLKTNSDIAPYAGYVNDGTRKMAPRRFTEIAEALLDNKATEIMETQPATSSNP